MAGRGREDTKDLKEYHLRLPGGAGGRVLWKNCPLIYVFFFCRLRGDDIPTETSDCSRLIPVRRCEETHQSQLPQAEIISFLFAVNYAKGVLCVRAFTLHLRVPPVCITPGV